MPEITQILSNIEAGDPHAAAELLPIVYEELRKLAKVWMASERSDHTLQGTALVHEAFIRLVDADQAKQWANRAHFFAAAAESMRRILIESARSKQSQKRGNHHQRLSADSLELAATAACDPDLLLDIDAGLARLAVEDAEAAELVKLRLFAGLSVTEAGKLLGLSRTDAYRTWDYVRSWFAVHHSANDTLESPS